MTRWCGSTSRNPLTSFIGATRHCGLSSSRVDHRRKWPGSWAFNITRCDSWCMSFGTPSMRVRRRLSPPFSRRGRGTSPDAARRARGAGHRESTGLGAVQSGTFAGQNTSGGDLSVPPAVGRIGFRLAGSQGGLSGNEDDSRRRGVAQFARAEAPAKGTPEPHRRPQHR